MYVPSKLQKSYSNKEKGMENTYESADNITPTPILSDEARENRVIAAAYNLAERQINEGTASAMVITHFLKLGSEKEKLEREKLQRENELLRAKVDAYEQAKLQERDYSIVIAALKSYNGLSDTETDL